MPRLPRLQPPGGYFHLTARGNRRAPIYVDAHDAARFMSLFATAHERFRWRCHGFCLMPNHYHLLVETPTESLAEGMQFLNGTYARAFNRRHGYDGHLFARRYRSVLLASTWHLLELSRYLALNPVRAGLCADPAEWRWGSYRAVVGLASSPAFFDPNEVLGLFGSTPAAAREQFTKFVADGFLMP